MTKILRFTGRSGMWLAAALVIALMASAAVAWVGVNLPAAAIEYGAGTFDRSASGGVLHDAATSAKWFTKDGLNFSTITGYAHSGQQGLTQGQANARLTTIQIWGWRDTNGDGAATIDDARTSLVRTTKWVLLSEDTTPAAVGYDTNTPGGTSGWGNVLQGAAFPIAPGESWLLLIRVINSAGDTNLMDEVGGVEQWEDGDGANMIGSNVPRDRYLDKDGKDATGAQRIQDDDIVWVYRAK